MLQFSPQILLEAVPPIPSHAIVALAAAGLGGWQLAATKGTRTHRIVGWLFVVGMAYVAVSGIFISTIGLWGPFSPIHLLIPLTLYGLWRGVRLARQGAIEAHKRQMVVVFVLALVLTGGFTLYPGRILNKVIFGPTAATEMNTGN